jgi:hypothetical protein
MSVSTRLSIKKMMNIRKSFARQAKMKFLHGGELHVQAACPKEGRVP